MKKLFAFALALTCVLGLVGCSSSTRTFEISGAEKIVVTSGTTGESVEITDADDIEYITDNVNALKYELDGIADSSGWSYALTWLDGEENVIEELTLLDSSNIIYDRYDYKVMSTSDEIDIAFLDRQFAE